MKTEIYNIKKLTIELERAAEFGNVDRVQNLLDEIMIFCNKIKEDIKDSKNVSHKVDIEQINQIPFLYKPILKKNYYEGNYLEQFARQRTYELKNTRALDMHNKFWQSYEAIRGNVFGSLPSELIRYDSIEKLKRYGWQETMVDVLEVKERKCTIRDLTEHCEQNYNHFVIINEKYTGAELILYYLI